MSGILLKCNDPRNQAVHTQFVSVRSNLSGSYFTAHIYHGSFAGFPNAILIDVQYYAFSIKRPHMLYIATSYTPIRVFQFIDFGRYLGSNNPA